VLVLLSCIFFTSSAVGQKPQPAEQSAPGSDQELTSPPSKAIADSARAEAPTDSQTEAEKKKGGIAEGIVVAPLPISSPAIGTGIIPVLGYIFSISAKDKVSPPSFVGAAGLVTDNGSRAFALAGQLYMKEGRYRITSAFLRGNINYDIYGNGIAAGLKLPLVQTGHLFFGEFLRRVWWKFLVGPRFLTGNSLITANPNTVAGFPPPPDIGLQTTLTAIGIHLLLDTSPNRFYPTKGTYFSFTSDFFSQSLGSKYSFQSYKTVFDKYWSLSKSQVLAVNGYFCATGGTPPFYGNCIYGANNELRGYIPGRYFTRYMVASQIEYRLALPMRLGLVAFGGLGGVIPGNDQFLAKQEFLPGGGGGLRFLLSKKYHVNLRADIAQGNAGHTFTMGIGEAF
jgi:hypothetical protein